MTETERSRSGLWGLLILVILVAVVLTLTVRDSILNDIDEGFIKFQPDASLFPAAPVAGAETTVGIGVPEAMQGSRPEGCPYDVHFYEKLEPTNSFSDRANGREKAVRGREWHTVRYDWEANGDAQAWVISERTVAFVDLAEGEKYVNELRDGLTYCGWGYDSGALNDGEYNRIVTDLDGLPKDSFAFVIDLSPTSDAIGLRSSDPDDFEGLGAVMPGQKPGHMVFMSWIGWSADVPPDEFVATANRIYDAANAAPDPDTALKKDQTTVGDDRFAPFDPGESQVLSLLGGDEESSSVLRSSPAADACQLDWNRTMEGYLFPQDLKSYYYPEFALESSDRVVEFVSAGFLERWRYLSAKDRLSQVLTPLCMSTLQRPRALMEPITLPAGLPPGAQGSLWHDGSDGDTYIVLLTDDERQLIMVVGWAELDSTPPEPLFVEAINVAWTEFVTANG